MLSVNTHDQVAGLDVGAADAQAFRELQAENQRLKEAIEQAWDDAGLPTFLRYLREYIRSQSRDVADPSGQSPSAGDPTDRPPHA
jgi:cell division protein FtsB